MNEINNGVEKALRIIVVAVAVILIPVLMTSEVIGYACRGIAELFRNMFREPLDLSHDMIERIRRATYGS